MIIENIKKYISGESKLSDKEVDELVSELTQEEANLVVDEAEKIMLQEGAEKEYDISYVSDENEPTKEEIKKKYEELEREKQEMLDAVLMLIENAYNKTIVNNQVINEEFIPLNEFRTQFISNLSSSEDSNSWIERKFTTKEGFPERIAISGSECIENFKTLKKVVRNNYKLLKAIYEYEKQKSIVTSEAFGEILKKYFRNNEKTHNIKKWKYVVVKMDENAQRLLDLSTKNLDRDINSSKNILTRDLSKKEIEEIFIQLINKDSDGKESEAFVF